MLKHLKENGVSLSMLRFRCSFSLLLFQTSKRCKFEKMIPDAQWNFAETGWLLWINMFEFHFLNEKEWTLKMQMISHKVWSTCTVWSSFLHPRNCACLCRSRSSNKNRHVAWNANVMWHFKSALCFLPCFNCKQFCNCHVHVNFWSWKKSIVLVDATFFDRNVDAAKRNEACDMQFKWDAPFRKWKNLKSWKCQF